MCRFSTPARSPRGPWGQLRCSLGKQLQRERREVCGLNHRWHYWQLYSSQADSASCPPRLRMRMISRCDFTRTKGDRRTRQSLLHIQQRILHHFCRTLFSRSPVFLEYTATLGEKCYYLPSV